MRVNELTSEQVARFTDGKWHRTKELGPVIGHVLGGIRRWGLLHGKYDPAQRRELEADVIQALLRATTPLGYKMVEFQELGPNEEWDYDEPYSKFRLIEDYKAPSTPPDPVA